jgi:hypothetical protein
MKGDTRSSQILMGVLMVAVGLIFLSDQMGWVLGWHLSFSRLWPLLLIVLGVGRVIVHDDVEVTGQALPGDAGVGTTPTQRRYRLGDGFWLVLVGTLLLMHTNHVMRLDQSWPLFIVGGGLALILGGRRSRKPRREGR